MRQIMLKKWRFVNEHPESLPLTVLLQGTTAIEADQAQSSTQALLYLVLWPLQQSLPYSAQHTSDLQAAKTHIMDGSAILKSKDRRLE